MICSLSGNVMECPVIAICGYMFEKELIEKYILDSGKCPVTGEVLSMDDIYPITTPTQIPDAVTPNNTSSSYSKTAEENDSQKLQDLWVDEIRCNAEYLQHKRLVRRIPTSPTSIDGLHNYILSDTHQLHKTKMPGIISLDIDNSKDIIATCGADGNAIVFDQVSGNVISALEGHTKQVTSIKFVKEGELLITGSADSTVRLWQRLDDGSYKYKHILDHHTAEVQAVTIHPSHKYFVTASLDRSWNVYDLSCDLNIVACAKGSEEFTSAAFHPDGRIIATGTSRFVRFWNASKQDDICRIDAHSAPVRSVAFSENGFHLATGAVDGMKLWDLRFMKNLMTFPSSVDTHTCPVDFDHTGLYLACGGSHMRVYNIASSPKYETIYDYSGVANITSLKFGKDAKYIAAGAHDSNLLLFSSLKQDDIMEP